MLVAGWRKHHDLIGVSQRTVAAPGSTELVDMAAHQVTVSQHPSVTVLIYGVRVATRQFGLSLEFLVNAMVAGVGAGRLVALHSGRCDITATLAVQGTNVLTKQAHFKLPGVVPLSPGIRLLSARHYPGQAESAGDNHPSRRHLRARAPFRCLRPRAGLAQQRRSPAIGRTNEHADLAITIDDSGPAIRS